MQQQSLVKLPAGVPDTPGWRAAYAAHLEGKTSFTLARRLLRRAKARTLDLDVLGENVTISWPSVADLRRIQAAADGLKDVTDINVILERGQAFTREIGRLVQEETVRTLLSTADEGAIELAGLIMAAVPAAQKKAQAAVATFRGK